MTKPAIVFGGFSRVSYVAEARELFPRDSHRFVCIKGRLATQAQAEYLSYFDEVYDVDDFPAELKDTVLLVTCTQERDIKTYFKILHKLGSITDTQFELWNKVVNKRQFKELMNEKWPQLVPKQQSFTPETFADLKFTYPQVLKPIGLSGSSLVQVVKNEAELSAYIAAVKERAIPEIIAEEFVAGPQYSLNVYVNAAGSPTFCPLVRVIPDFEWLGVDTYSALQYNTTLESERYGELQDAVVKIIELFQIRDTSAHFDCIYSDTGWKICEVGLRIGGLRQELFNLSYGFSHLANDLRNRIRQEPTMGAKQTTTIVIQKTPEQFGALSDIKYVLPSNNSLNFELAKLAVGRLQTGPVSQGGVVAFRAFLSGEDEDVVIKEAKALFESVTFLHAENEA